MLEQANSSSIGFTTADPLRRTASYRINRRIWLPKVVYDALPFFYLFSGIAAFAATVYIGAWYWVVPHYVIFSAACLHLALIVIRRRRKSRPNESGDAEN